MKKGFLFIAVFCASLICKANKIDDLNTDEQVMAFIKPLLKEKFNIEQLDLSFSVQENMACKNLTAHENLKKWSKADFNNDGFTDLFLNIYQATERPMILVVMANSSENYRIINLNQLRSSCEFGYTDKPADIPLIILKRKDITKQKKDTIKTDTLQYLNLVDNFIGLKKTHAPYNIQRIEFSTDHCFGVCPVFSFAIDDKGNAVYDAIEYNAQQGKFKVKLSSEANKLIIQLLNDIDFPNLKDNYAVAWTDQQTATLKITYNNGEIKTITDYGMKENFSLSSLYGVLLNLRESQHWIKQ